MPGCQSCGLPGYDEPIRCPVCSPAIIASQGGWGPGPTQAEKDAQRAKLVRQALRSLANDATAFATLANEGSDAALSKLARLLKHAS